jgi:HemK-like putative methylase
MMDKEEAWLLKEKYHGEKSLAWFADCKRLMLGEPLAYLIGFVPFLDCTIFLDSRPLIPRPETEYWVAEAITAIRGSATLPLGLPQTKQLRILDLCAGSGCIGVAVAKAFPTAQVDFGELDAQHLPTIQKNVRENNLDETHCNAVHSNLFSHLPHTYDCILANPPYIDPALDRTEESVKTHEPYVALYGGKEGLEIIEQIIATAPAHLSLGGQLWLEHEPEQSIDIQALGSKHGFLVTTHKDQFGVLRYSVLVLQ